MTALMIESAIRALLFALVVGAGLRLFRVSNVPVRKAAWSLVLVASLAIPFLMQTPAIAAWKAQWGWSVPVPVHGAMGGATVEGPVPAVVHRAPVVPTAFLRTRDARGDGNAAPLAAVAVSTSLDAAPLALTPAARGGTPARFHWPPADRLIAMIYVAVAGILVLRLLWGLARALRLWASAELVSPLIAPEPHVRSSAKIASPVTIGSGIVLPANYREWDHGKLRMVIAHERSHVRQMDFYLQLVAGVYAAAFWFSPLGWWLRRTLASLGEAIGDRAGMDAAKSRSIYAEVLLEFAALPRQPLPGVAMARPGNLSHRVERLLNEQIFRSAFAEGRRRAMVSLLLIPAALFAAMVLVRTPGAKAQTAPQAPVAPAPAVAPAAPSVVPLPPAVPDGEQATAAPAVVPEAPEPPAVPAGSTPAVAPMAPAGAGAVVPGIAPVPPVPPTPEAVEQDPQGGSTFGYANDGESYAIVQGSGGNVTFTGSWNGEEREELDAARRVTKGPFLWFRHDGKSYIVTDPAVIARIRAMYAPMEALGRQQEALGGQQEALGKQMEELGRLQESAGAVKMPDLSREMAELDRAMAQFKVNQASLDSKELAGVEKKMKAEQDQMLTPEKMAELQSGLAAAQTKWNSEGMAAMQEKLAALQERLGELQGEAGARQGDFGGKMGALGAQQGKLGAEQGRLGAEQGRIAARADRETRRIIEECLRNGKATALPQVK